MLVIQNIIFVLVILQLVVIQVLCSNVHNNYNSRTDLIKDLAFVIHIFSCSIAVWSLPVWKLDWYLFMIINLGNEWDLQRIIWCLEKSYMPDFSTLPQTRIKFSTQIRVSDESLLLVGMGWMLSKLSNSVVRFKQWFFIYFKFCFIQIFCK